MKKVPNKTQMPYVFIVDLLLTVHKLQGPAAGGNTLLVRQGSGCLRVQQLCRHQEVVRRQRILEDPSKDDAWREPYFPQSIQY